MYPLFEECMSGERLAEFRHETEIKLSQDEVTSRLSDFYKSDNSISEKDNRIFDKLLGDQDLLAKLVFVRDASYRNNIIRYMEDTPKSANGLHFRIKDNYYPYENDSFGADSIAVLEHMKNNYETICT